MIPWASGGLRVNKPARHMCSCSVFRTCSLTTWLRQYKHALKHWLEMGIGLVLAKITKSDDILCLIITVSSAWLCRNTAQSILSFKCVFIYQHLMFTQKIMPNFIFMCTTTQSSTPTTAEQCKAPQTAWEIQLRNCLENQGWLKDSGSVSPL